MPEPELSRRLKRQRFWDDHAEAIGTTIAYLAFTTFLLALVSMVIFDTPMRWTLWLLIPVVVGAVIAAAGDGPRHPEAHDLSAPRSRRDWWRS
jgi:peptidoglycan/LPS O-acetylase OafA/YrhL